MADKSEEFKKLENWLAIKTVDYDKLLGLWHEEKTKTTALLKFVADLEPSVLASSHRDRRRQLLKEYTNAN